MYGNGAGTGGVTQSAARPTLRARLPALAACGAVVPGLAAASAALFLTVAAAARMTAAASTACVWFVTPTRVG